MQAARFIAVRLAVGRPAHARPQKESRRGARQQRLRLCLQPRAGEHLRRIRAPPATPRPRDLSPSLPVSPRTDCPPFPVLLALERRSRHARAPAAAAAVRRSRRVGLDDRWGRLANPLLVANQPLTSGPVPPLIPLQIKRKRKPPPP